MAKRIPLDLGRRERQIVEIIYSRERASVSEVLGDLPDPPSYSAVRAMMNTLVEKGQLKRKKSGKKFYYAPTTPRSKARQSVLRKLLSTFFNGSAAQAVASLIEMDEQKLSSEELDQLAKLIEDARKKGQKE